MPETSTPPPPPAAVAADDTISSLTEDLLLIILGFLPAATDVVRTSALSTRWRHLWTLAPALRFDVGPRNLRLTDDVEAAADGRLVAAVDSVLARRDVAGMPDVKDLVINFVYRSVVGGDEPTTGCSRSRFGTSRRRRLQRHLPLDITPASVAAWLRFAERRVAGAFSLDLPALSRNTRASLPSSEKLHSMRLKLGGATIGVPNAGAAYRSLADVLLSNVCLKDGDDVRLGNLLSSTSCPHLRRLELSAITGLTNLHLDATATFEELRLIGLRDMEQMEVDAPGLRELIVKGISVHLMAAARITAARLQALTYGYRCWSDVGQIMVLDGERTAKLRVLSHGDPAGKDNSAAAWFLQHCAAADRLDVELRMEFDEKKHQAGIEDVIKDTPKLPNITDLRITVAMSTGTMDDTHAIGATITKLIAKFSRIEYLSIDIDKKAGDCTNFACKCEHYKDWNNEMIPLECLRIADIRDFLPFDDQIELQKHAGDGGGGGGGGRRCHQRPHQRRAADNPRVLAGGERRGAHLRAVDTVAPPLDTRPALRFDVGPRNWRLDGTAESAAAAGRLLDAVDSVLARRDGDAGGADVKDLEINFVHRSEGGNKPNRHSYARYVSHFRHRCDDLAVPLDITPARVAAWFRFAERRVAGAFSLKLPALSSRTTSGSVPAVLPCSERLHTMRLTLGGTYLGVPNAAGAGAADAYRSLTDLLLSNVCLNDDGDDLRLCNLLSSTSCPHLRRLELRDIDGLINLRLDAAATLEELRLIGLRHMDQMEVDAPGLRELTVERISLHLMEATAARITAPRLQAMTYDYAYWRGEPMVLDGKRTAKLQLLSHGVPRKDNNTAAAWFLQHCSAADRLDVELKVEFDEEKIQEGIEDVIKDIPELPNITDLRITVAISTGTVNTHAIGASVTKLIAKFSRIEYLSIDIDKKAGDCTIFDCKCEQHKGWNNEMIPLEHLRMVDIRGFLHFNDQIELVCVLIASAPVLEKMIVALHESYEETRGRRNDMEAYLCIPSCGGRWTPCAWNGNKFDSATKYEWKPCKRKRRE